MRLRQRLGLRAGLAILTAAAVLLEIALHRVYSALFGHHLALAVLPLALIGAGLGGVVLQLAPGLARPPALLERLGYLASLAGAATLGTLLIVLHVKPIDSLDATALGRLAALALAASLPFVLSGMAAFAILRHAARDVGRLGFTAFAAAALAGPLAVALIRIGGPRVGLVVIILDALAALTFYLTARFSLAPSLDADRHTPPVPRASGGVVATALLASSVLLAGDLGAPWVKVAALRWGPLDKAEVQEWTPLGLVTVDKATGGTAQIRTDGTAAVPMLEGKHTIPLSADEMIYVLRKEGSPVLVAGATGGREVRLAQKYAQKEIHAVEPSGYVSRALLRDRYRKWTGDVLDKPEVRATVEDPRGYLRRAARFRTIVVPLPDTQTPAALGALAAVPVHAYTVEALRDALDRLTPDGTLLVSRWDTDVDRFFALTAAALRAVGIPDPAQHVYACGATRSTSVLISRAALTVREVQQLRAHCRKNKLNEAFAPDQPHSELRRRLLTDPDPAIVAAAEPVNMTPPTDDHPYYFASLPRRPLAATLSDLKVLQTSQQALFVLAGLLVLTLVAWLLGLALPGLRPPHGRERGARQQALGYFSMATAALVLAALAFGARLPLLLGHPGHALTTVQVALFAFAGGGSLLASRGHVVFAEASVGYRAQALVVVLAIAAIALGPIVDAGLGLPLPARLGIAIALLAPIGVLLGSLLPLGIKLLAARTPELLPWSLGVGALGGAVAAVLGVLLAMLLGQSALLLAAALAALLAAGSVPAAPRRW